MSKQEILLNQGQGRSFWVLGDLYIFKVTGQESDGAFTVIEQVIQPQGGPPPHVHHREDEAFYILDGTFSFLSGETQAEYQTGAFVYIPKGTLHTFKNVSERPGKLLVVITPAGLEEFFYSIGSHADDATTPPPFDPAVIDKIMKLSKKYEMDVRLPG